MLQADGLNIVLAHMLDMKPDYSMPKYAAALRDADKRGVVARWGVVMFFFLDQQKRRLDRIAATYLYLDEGGKPIPTPVIPLAPLDDLRLAIDAGAPMEDAVRLMEGQEHPILFALSLMNAKNVSIVDAPPLPPAVAKKRERKGQPVLKFKTLHIEPMRARVKREKQEGQSEVKLALHLCRGHFKDYRDSGGLFGKYKGLYWRDSHVRGTEEAGRVIKDYELGKPKGA